MIDENKLKQALIKREVTTAMYDIVDREISYLPKEEVIPLDRIKEAREEIKDMQSHIQLKDKTTNEHWIFVDKFEVLEILDKLIAESEE